MNQAANETEKPPLPGANSFTENQARERIAKAGFEDVQGLKKDDQGVWRGQAKKSGHASQRSTRLSRQRRSAIRKSHDPSYACL